MRWMRWLAAVMALALMACEYDETTREIGHTGRARANPYLAAERFLEHYGYRAGEGIGWPDFDDPDLSMVVMPVSVLRAAGYVSLVRDWVADGGHLVLLLEGGESHINDWSERKHRSTISPDDQDHGREWLDDLGIGITEDGEKTAEEVRVLGEDFEVWMESEERLEVDGEPSFITSKKYGDGRISVMADASPLRNRYLGEHDHAKLLLALADASDYGDIVVFLRHASLSFWSLLWDRGWPGVIALLVLVLVWLWKSLPRFGPLDSADGGETLRASDHHLEALGGFHWQLDKAHSLLHPLRAGLLERGHHLALATGRADADVFEVIAERAGLTRERVEKAMTVEIARDASGFTRLTADLQTIHRSMP